MKWSIMCKQIKGISVRQKDWISVFLTQQEQNEKIKDKKTIILKILN